MKKIDGIAINRSNSARKVSLSDLKDSGKSRDNLLLFKGDQIEIPEDLDVWIDSFTPKGGSDKVDYYLLTVKVNDQIFDATMASFRRMKSVADDDLDKALSTDVNRKLYHMSDDEQRASYLQGKTLLVKDSVKLKNRFDETRFVTVPILEIA